MSENILAERVRRLADLPRVGLCLAADLEEGLVISAAGERSEDAAAVAALFASLYRRSVAAAAAHGAGEPRTVRLECAAAHVLAAVGASTLLVAVAERGANLGRIRLGLLRAVEAAE